MRVTITNDMGNRFSFGYDPENDYVCLPDDAPISHGQAYAIIEHGHVGGWRRQPAQPATNHINHTTGTATPR